MNVRLKQKKYLEMINQNQALIYKVASIYTDSKQDKQDLMQDIYFQLWKSFDSFEERSKISTWLYRISLNTSIQYLKKKKRKLKQVDLKEEHIDIGIQSQDAKADDLQRMFLSIQKLNELDKGIILLYLEEKSHKEIAEIVGLSETNIGTRIQRIKIKLSKLKNDN